MRFLYLQQADYLFEADDLNGTLYTYKQSRLYKKYCFSVLED